MTLAPIAYQSDYLLGVTPPPPPKTNKTRPRLITLGVSVGVDLSHCETQTRIVTMCHYFLYPFIHSSSLNYRRGAFSRAPALPFLPPPVARRGGKPTALQGWLLLVNAKRPEPDALRETSTGFSRAAHDRRRRRVRATVRCGLGVPAMTIQEMLLAPCRFQDSNPDLRLRVPNRVIPDNYSWR